MRQLRIGANAERDRDGQSVRGRAAGGGAGAATVWAVRREGGEDGGLAATLRATSEWGDEERADPVLTSLLFEQECVLHHEGILGHNFVSTIFPRNTNSLATIHFLFLASSQQSV